MSETAAAARDKMGGTTPQTADTGHGGDMAKRKAKNAHLVEPTWGESEGGGPPLTELTSVAAGALSPFGEDHSFPLPVDLIRYAHPTDRPNRAGVMAGEGR